MSQLFSVVMENHHNRMKMEQVRLLLHQMIRSGEYIHLMEQNANLLHYDEEMWIFHLKDYTKFVRNIKKFTFLHHNGASLHFAPSNEYIPQTLSFDGAISELAPFSFCCDDFPSQQKKVVTYLFHHKME